ncbi:MAG: ABC transporter permease subunit [Myxococcaceae bacterium]|nr:ABC transporter permease subunit [Myxococcaceae bacterium]MCI0672912.1 ABC transporter permease subunit [Myxococcaceae bacterium]
MKVLLSQVWAVLRAEWLLHFRDRRALVSALLVPLMGPAIFLATFTAVAARVSTEQALVLPVVGREHAPSLVGFLERSGVTVQEAPADYEARVLDGRLDVVLIVPSDYGEAFSGGRPAQVQLLMDQSRTRAQAPMRRARILLETYSATIGAQRLLARGVSPTLARPLRVEELDLSTPEKLAATLLRTIPIFLVMAAFVGAMSVAIDTTAGERERASLEPLLLNPVDRRALVVGKWLAAVTVGLLGLGVCVAGFALAVRRVPLEDLGVKVVLGPAEVGLLFITVLPLALLAPALQMLVAIFARSFKEAQTYLTGITFLPVVPGVVLTFRAVQDAPWMWGVPALGQDLLVSAVMRGEGVPALGVFLSTASALTLTVVLLGTIARLLGQERIVFGR